MPFTLEELVVDEDSQVGRDAASLKRLTVASGRGTRHADAEDDALSFSVMPSQGAVQVLKEGEAFYVWLFVGGSHKNVELSLVPSCEKSFGIVLVRDFGDRRFLYRASMDHALAGTYSLHVVVDDVEEMIDSCIIVEPSEHI